MSLYLGSTPIPGVVAGEAAVTVQGVKTEVFEAHANDTTIHVTDAEKDTWNSKSDFSGDYNDLTNKPTIPSIDGLATTEYVDGQIAAIPTPDVSGPIGEHNNSAESHADIRDTIGALEAIVSGKADGEHEHGQYLTEIPAEYVTDTELNAKGYLTSIPAEYVTETELDTHNTNTNAHGDIRDLIAGLTTRLNTLADSDDTTLDQMSEIVAYIKSNKSLIDSITTSKVNVADIVDNITTNVSNKPLSAAQGVVLKALIDSLEKTDVGLGNVDNTSDVNKPVSTAQAAAIADAKKAGTDAQANLTTHNSSASAHADIRSKIDQILVDAKSYTDAQTVLVTCRQDVPYDYGCYPLIDISMSCSEILDAIRAGKNVVLGVFIDSPDADPNVPHYYLQPYSVQANSSYVNISFSACGDNDNMLRAYIYEDFNENYIEAEFYETSHFATEERLTLIDFAKVDKVDGKGLSTNDYTTTEKNKLAGIAAGAEVNVNADWNATSGDAQILNKPTLGTLAAKSTVAKTDLASDVQTSLGKADTALQSYTETDPTVPSWAKASSKPSYSASEVGADASGTAASAVSSHNTSGSAHTDIRNLVTAAQNTANGKASTATYTATVTTSWTASGSYYYQNITVSGITANDNPVVDILPGSDNAANVTYSECICKVFRIVTSANSIQVWATEAIATAFPIQLKVVR